MAAIDVIMPLYNKQATVERAIRSVQSQTLADWRLIVVDDGSTDGGAEIVRRIQKEDGRIELIVQANAGPGAARNAGIRAATAPYVAFLDADDLWYPWHLKTAMAAIQKNNVAMVGTMYYEWPAQIDMTAYWARCGVVPGVYRLTGNEAAEKIESFLYFFTMDTTVIRTETTRRYGGFFESRCRYGEDTVLIASIILNEAFMVLGGKPSARYNRQHSELTGTANYPLNPMLLEPDILLKYCPATKEPFARELLARMALRNAYLKARNGHKAEALKLVELHPQMKTFGRAWRRCQFAITFSKILPYWVRFKCRVGPPVRRFCRQLAYKLNLLQPPPVITEVDSTESKK
ncbi:MAG: glycosyltransferase family 2 protein [Planctomycetes bacterium]|nr:glycosyltransferase family 2 protein [Planctomycetota bacterium]